VNRERYLVDEARGRSLRAAFGALDAVAGNGAACPDADALWDAAAGRQEPADFERVVLHIGECGECAAAWRLARDLQADEARSALLRGPARWFRRTWVQALAAAATLVVAVGVGYQLRDLGRPGTAEFRGAEGEWIRSLVPEGAALPRGRCLLRWTPGPAHTVYDVRVTTEDLEPVARSRGLERAEFLVPEEALKGVPGGGRVVWQVTAILPDATKSESRSFATRIR